MNLTLILTDRRINVPILIYSAIELINNLK